MDMWPTNCRRASGFMRKPICVAVVALAIALQGCASVAIPDGVQNAAESGCEQGYVERQRLVMSGPDGIALDKRSETRVPSGVYQQPAEGDVELGMAAAASAGLVAQPLPRNPRQIGAAYMVRLQCGGLVYVFELGSPRFAAGNQVLVERGLKPRLIAR
ncbi:exported hypothetical protein [uncultured Defluviicoccus sp.]|uniref:Lipoprotein n=1 Tax=metagenome TaxID=256318 RepID=A0A380T7K8_9ZZZZ|nr:exported hypothetical protein [uncultured Defluviicoccus sp.]